jgi:CubicO group peptidase (beta-lactamase class C family)
MKDFIEKARASLRIPGVAISLYQDGKVVFESGFGVRVGPADAHRCGDAFHGRLEHQVDDHVVAATLVDEGKLTWDTPITAVMPDFSWATPRQQSRCS